MKEGNNIPDLLHCEREYQTHCISMTEVADVITRLWLCLNTASYALMNHSDE